MYLQFDKHNEVLWVTFPSRFVPWRSEANVYTYVAGQKTNKTIAFLEQAPVLGRCELTGEKQIFPCPGKETTGWRKEHAAHVASLTQRWRKPWESERETQKRGWKAQPVGIVSGEFTVPTAIPGSIFCICSPRQRRQSRNLFSRPSEQPNPPRPFKILVNHWSCQTRHNGDYRKGHMDEPKFFCVSGRRVEIFTKFL